MITRHNSGRVMLRKEGVALVLVLVFTAMLLVLVMMVLEIGTNSTRHSGRVARRNQAAILATMPEQIVMAQLRRATMSSRAADGEPLLWTSQPGMIRIFGTRHEENGERPTARMYHRLYSAAEMSSELFDANAEAASLSTWATQSGGFTDLNEPVTSTRSAAGTSRLFYPIADPRAAGKVEGFRLEASAPGVAAAHPLPMPVRWLYVLKDSRLVLPERVEGSRAYFSPEVVTEGNPIQGRIAFWTDDESCKLNLNTASEGVFHDMPAANTVVDAATARRAISAQQYSWFSAHPAFTSLSPVLRGFGGSGPESAQWPRPDPAGWVPDADWQRYVDSYQTPARYLASVDDFFGASRHGQAKGLVMEPDDLDESRFFLTVRSASPDLNPFGYPKIALWMPSQNSTERREIDREVLAASTINLESPKSREFAFLRSSLWQGTANPGSAQRTTDDWSQVPTNRELHGWLERLSGLPLPGFGASFVDKYGSRSRDQLLISMIDMLRWGTLPNIALPPPAGSSNSLGLGAWSAVPLMTSSSSASTKGYGRFPTLVEVAVVFVFTDVERGADGLPLDENDDGICDRATALRAFLVIRPLMPAAAPAGVSAAWSVRFRRLMHWTVGPGLSLMLPGGNVLNRCSYSTTQSAAKGEVWAEESGGYAGFAAQFMQPNGLPKEIGRRDDPSRDFPFISASDVKLTSPLGLSGTSLNFSGGNIIVDLMPVDALAGSPKPDDSIHSVEVEFPQAVPLPVPALRVADFVNGPRSLTSRWLPVKVNGALRFPLIQEGDVVRSVILNASGPSRGDARLLAARRELFLPDAAQWFAPSAGYGTNTSPSLQLQAHSLPSLSESPQVMMRSSLFGLVNPAPNALPSVPAGLGAATMLNGAAGDWESGAGALEDGPFISREPFRSEAALCRSGPTNLEFSVVDSPLAQIPSAVAFGALPSAVFGGATDSVPRPWQTLLFCPNPAAQGAHPGFASPPDHLWLEFFHAPVTRPWAMTHDFATEGRVNLNHALVPFTWLYRATALHGALKGVRLYAIPAAAMDDQGDSAKGRSDGSPVDISFRYEVDAERTLQGIDGRFHRVDVFRVPSEICEHFLVPRRITGHRYEEDGLHPRDPEAVKEGDMADWWQGSPTDPADAFEATGDNLREAPYAALHPRLCTQSNVFRVHYRVQALQQPRDAEVAVWDEGKGILASEQRGSSVIERSLMSDSVLADPVSDVNATSLHERQHLRVISRHHFQP